jgi:GH18 family chitinase
MGFSQDYTDVPNWVAKPEGYQTGAMVKYQGNVFYANFWATEPGVGDANRNGWRFYDELYDQTSAHTPETKRANIIAYIPTWRKKEDFDHTNSEIYKHITHGIVSFLMFDETRLGEFEPNSMTDVKAILPDVVKIGYRHATRILIALGGAEDYGFLKLMTAIGNNPAHPLLNTAVNNVVNFVKLHKLDGVELDLECWWGKPGEPDQGGRLKSAGPHPAGYALTLFAQRLKQALPGKLVSAAVFGTSWYGNNYDPQIADYVDWLGIMTYDLTGSWNASPVGPHSALFKIRNQATQRPNQTGVSQESYANQQQGEWPGGGPVDNPILSVEDTLWYWTNPSFVNWQGEGQKIPRRKIAAGVPIYGYDFAAGKDPDDLSGQVPPGYKVIRYKDILAQFPEAYKLGYGNIQVPGSTPTPPFILPSGTYPFKHNIYFESPDMAVAKLKFLKEIGAQGVIIWELSNDVWDEGKSIIRRLYENSGNPAVRPPINGRRYNECSFLCTHNSFVNYEDARWTLPNQSMSITNQLKQGVRALMLDTHYYYPKNFGFDFFNVITEPGVYLLHGVNERDWILGLTYTKPAQRLYNVLYDVWRFLDDNPNEVVTIFLEDYTTADQLQIEFDFIVRKETAEERNGQKFLQRIYNPDTDSNWKVKEKKQWPLLSDLIAWDKRVIIFSSRNSGQYVAYDRDYTKQSYWSLGFDHSKWDCPSRWDNGQYDNQSPYPKLFVFSHHRDVPSTLTAQTDNSYKEIMNRIDYQCSPKTNQLPNFVAVDFFEVSPNEREIPMVQDAVNELNRRWQEQSKL